MFTLSKIEAEKDAVLPSGNTLQHKRRQDIDLLWNAPPPDISSNSNTAPKARGNITDGFWICMLDWK